MRPTESRRLGFEHLELRRVLAPLANGQESLGSFAIGGTSSFEFSATSGNTILVSAGETGALTAEVTLNVFGPAGQLLQTNSGADKGVVQLTATATGTFTAIVSDTGNDEAMSFRIRALVLPGTPTAIVDRDSPLANGQEFLSSLPLGGFNFHTFSVTSGNSILVSVGENGDLSGEPMLQVYGPGGVLLHSDSGADDAVVQFSAAASGVFTAVVREGSDDEALSYRIRALILPGTPSTLVDRDSAPANGEEFTSSLPLGGFNIHRFTAAAGGSILVSVGETGGLTAEPNLQIYGPGGVLLQSDSGTDEALLQFGATSSGTYTAVVSDMANDEALSYRIRVLALPASSAAIGGRDFTLVNGQQSASSLPLGGFNVHRFTASAGGNIVVAISETGALGSEPKVQIYGPGGLLLHTDDGTDGASVQFNAASSGTFTAIVTDEGNDEALSYQIQATGVTTPVLYGDYNQNGLVDAGDYVLWRRTLAAGGTFLPNDFMPNVVDNNDYTYWRAHFGEASNIGSALSEEALANSSTLTSGDSGASPLIATPVGPSSGYAAANSPPAFASSANALLLLAHATSFERDAQDQTFVAASGFATIQAADEEGDFSVVLADTFFDALGSDTLGSN
jgi:hypothetical protein